MSVKKHNKPRAITVVGEQARRLQALARRWGVAPDEALRRALDQAFVGRGALVALEAGLIALEHMTRKNPEEKP
jgi:transposase-like protein